MPLLPAGPFRVSRLLPLLRLLLLLQMRFRLHSASAAPVAGPGSLRLRLRLRRRRQQLPQEVPPPVGPLRDSRTNSCSISSTRPRLLMLWLLLHVQHRCRWRQLHMTAPGRGAAALRAGGAPAAAVRLSLLLPPMARRALPLQWLKQKPQRWGRMGKRQRQRRPVTAPRLLLLGLQGTGKVLRQQPGLRLRRVVTELGGKAVWTGRRQAAVLRRCCWEALMLLLRRWRLAAALATGRTTAWRQRLLRRPNRMTGGPSWPGH